MTERQPAAPETQPAALSQEAAESPRALELSRLYEQHNGKLVSFLAQRLGNEEEAWEVAQEAYVRVLQLDKPGAVNFLRAYLYKTASNIALDRIRHREHIERFAASSQGDHERDDRGPEQAAAGREGLETLWQALMELPKSHRYAYLLRLFHEASTEEIGRRLGLKTTQVRLYLRRALAYCQLRVDGISPARARKGLFK